MLLEQQVLEDKALTGEILRTIIRFFLVVLIWGITSNPIPARADIGLSGKFVSSGTGGYLVPGDWRFVIHFTGSEAMAVASCDQLGSMKSIVFHYQDVLQGVFAFALENPTKTKVVPDGLECTYKEYTDYSFNSDFQFDGADYITQHIELAIGDIITDSLDTRLYNPGAAIEPLKVISPERGESISGSAELKWDAAVKPWMQDRTVTISVCKLNQICSDDVSEASSGGVVVRDASPNIAHAMFFSTGQYVITFTSDRGETASILVEVVNNFVPWSEVSTYDVLRGQLKAHVSCNTTTLSSAKKISCQASLDKPLRLNTLPSVPFEIEQSTWVATSKNWSSPKKIGTTTLTPGSTYNFDVPTPSKLLGVYFQILGKLHGEEIWAVSEAATRSPLQGVFTVPQLVNYNKPFTFSVKLLKKVQGKCTVFIGSSFFAKPLATFSLKSGYGLASGSLIWDGVRGHTTQLNLFAVCQSSDGNLFNSNKYFLGYMP